MTAPVAIQSLSGDAWLPASVLEEPTAAMADRILKPKLLFAVVTRIVQHHRGFSLDIDYESNRDWPVTGHSRIRYPGEAPNWCVAGVRVFLRSPR